MPRTESIQSIATGLVRDLQAADHIAYFAGGCVRDMLMGLEPKDYDIATSATPDEVSRVFPHATAVGKSFGVMLVSVQGVPYEIATFRTEQGYTDGRHPDSVSFSSPEEDAQRRDFTVNAMFLDPLSEELMDFVNGQTDIRSRIIRAVGNPHERFAEDHLRMLRAIRFASSLDFTIEPDTLEAIAHHARALERISRERITNELSRMFEGPHPGMAIALLVSTGLWDVIVPNHTTTPPAFVRLLETAAPVSASVVYSLLSLHSTETSCWSEHLCISKRLQRDIDACLRDVEAIREWTTLQPAERRRLVAGHAFADACLVCDIAFPEHTHRDAINAYMRGIESPSTLPAPLVSGDDLIRAGLAPGAEMGRVLKIVYDRQLADPELSFKSLLSHAMAIAGSSSQT